MNTRFQDLGIAPPILQALEEMGFEAPTEVQSKAIPHILKQEDLIVRSKTGSGKTAAFGIPMLQNIDPTADGPKGLILTPTRELAVQVDNDLMLMARHLQFRTAVVYGQHSMNVEITELKKGASIVTGTPGRVFDHIRQGNLITKHISFLVLDEADRMLDMGFIDQVVRIIRTLPKNRVTLLFSATMPMEVQRICREYMKDPVTIEIESDTKTVDTIRQAYYRVERHEKRLQLNRLLTVNQPDSCMIFCNTRAAVDKVHEFLAHKGYAAQALHGDIHQSKRLKTIQQFKNGEFHLLVATDVAARGLHVDDLSMVINYDVPNEKDSYVHRIGRTGRAGNGGHAVTLVTSEDIISLYEIEEHIGVMIPEEELPSEAVVRECTASAAEKYIRVKPQRQPERTAGEGKPKAPGQKSGRSGERKPQSSKPARPVVDSEVRESLPKQGPKKPQQSAKPKHQQTPPKSAEGRPLPQAAVQQPAAKAEAPRGVRVSVRPGQMKAPEPVSALAPVTKQPLLKRIVQRLFGK